MAVRLPCHTHLWHDLESHETARVVATLTALYAEERVEADGSDRLDRTGWQWEEELICPLEALQLSQDGECFLEHVDSVLLATGAVREDPHGGLAVIPWGERDPKADGKDQVGYTGEAR